GEGRKTRGPQGPRRYGQSSSTSFAFFFAGLGSQSGGMFFLFHSSQSAFSSFTLSGFVADRSFVSPMSSFRLNSFTFFTPSGMLATSFQSPLRTAHCSPNRQYSAACGGSFFAPVMYGSRSTPSRFQPGSMVPPAAITHVGRMSSWMIG